MLAYRHGYFASVFVGNGLCMVLQCVGAGLGYWLMEHGSYGTFDMDLLAYPVLMP